MESDNKVKRVRRRVMTAETFARFCNRSAEVLQDAMNEFDPSVDEVERMLFHLGHLAGWFRPATKRRTQ